MQIPEMDEWDDDEESVSQAKPNQFEGFKFFANMPKHIRNEIKEDILTTALQDTDNELTKVPEQWTQVEQGKFNIKLSHIEKLISKEFSKLNEMNKKKASNEQSKDGEMNKASDEQNNILGSFIQTKDRGFDCYMWWPQDRKLVEV